MSAEAINEDRRLLDHPLFRTGIFLFPAFTSQGDSQFPGGYYNPVIDSIYLRYPRDEIIEHETTHRVFTIFSAGVWALRRLASMSYSLFFFLLDTLDKQGGQLVGRRLDTLRVVQPGSDEHVVTTIVSRLRRIEDLFDMCYWSLLPPVEIAAIDFAPGEGKYGWLAEEIENTQENRKRKNQHIDDVASLLARKDSPWLSVYDSRQTLQTELRRVWEAYSAIEDDHTREALLKLATSAILRDSQDRYVAENTLEHILNYMPHALEPGAESLLSERANRKFEEVHGILDEIEKKALNGIPDEYGGPLNLPTMIDSLILHSVPVPSNPILSHLNEDHTETVIDPFFSLLTFWVEPDGQQIVLVNPAYQFIVEQRLIPETPKLGKDWWRVAGVFESLRQVVKTGKPVICPFLRWEGVNCNEECSIRDFMAFLQANTELLMKDACRLES